jgi:hypothetical protein
MHAQVHGLRTDADLENLRQADRKGRLRLVNDELEDPLAFHDIGLYLSRRLLPRPHKPRRVTRLVRSRKISRRTGTRSTIPQGIYIQTYPGRHLIVQGPEEASLDP